MDFLEFLFRAVFSVVFIGLVVLGVFMFARVIVDIIIALDDWMDGGK